ncbi:MAG: MarR family transcriptional regulator [Phaeodactylibacter sp.]|nr:MarR family transcriptional regulator [Phaeodactylibacter sp.]
MEKSVFDPQAQAGSLEAKIVVALERIAEVFRVSLWNAGKEHGLSPLQIQLLIFLKFHSAEKCKVSYLAREFSLSKPTISEAVRTLLKKELIGKETDPGDTRSFSIHLSAEGEKLAEETASFANGLLPAFGAWSDERKKNFYGELLQLIASLQKLGFISIQRTCLKCRFFRDDKKHYYCGLLKMPLHPQDLRVDCPEFEEA